MSEITRDFEIVLDGLERGRGIEQSEYATSRKVAADIDAEWAIRREALHRLHARLLGDEVLLGKL